MKISYISDLHLDFYIKQFQDRSINRFIDNTFKEDSADILIISGDISHSNALTKRFLELLIQKKIYRKIFLCLGNHDYYLISKKSSQKYKYNSFNRINEMKNMIKEIENVQLLDGEVIEFEGKKIFGMNGWYDGSYYHRLTSGYGQKIEDFWRDVMNDSSYVKGIEDFLELAKIEKDKFRKFFDDYKDIKIDLAFSHVVPISEPIVLEDKYKTDKASGFFTFDGLFEIQKMNILNWVYGHCHDRKSFEIFGTNFHINALGYPNEMKNNKIITDGILIQHLII